MDHPPPPLSYDSAGGRPHPWVRRGLIFAAVAIAVALGSVWVGPLWRQSKLMYWQHRCATHKPSGRQFPKEWTEYSQLVSPPGVRSSGTVFLGELVSPAGQHVLVSVGLQIQTGQGGRPSLNYGVWIIEPASWPLTPAKVHFYTFHNFAGTGTGPFPITFDGGFVDPADRSHFHADLGPHNGVLDGWLDDNNRLKLETPL